MQEKTLLLLAEALELDLSDLLNGDGGANVYFSRRAPWSSRQLLIGYRCDADDGGRVDCLDLRSGRLLWTLVPDQQRATRVFGNDHLANMAFGLGSLTALDSDGDGTPEIAVQFQHLQYYPTVLCLVDAHGRVLRRYYSWGHIAAVVATDLDGDGRDELLAAGCNNAPVYQGATLILLDRDHWGGATFDALSRPGATVGDSSRVRLVFPSFGPAFAPYVGPRVSIRKLGLGRGADGHVRIYAGVGNLQYTLPVVLDRDLRPLSVDINDVFLSLKSTLPDSLTGPGTPFDPDWRERWLRSHLRFESGILVSPSSPPPLPLSVRPRT